MTRPKRSLTVIGDSETVKRRVFFFFFSLLLIAVYEIDLLISVCLFRGSKFLKKWMEFLEENADLRYPDVAQLGQE